MITSHTPSFAMNVCNYRQFATAKLNANKNSESIAGKKKATRNNNKKTDVINNKKSSKAKDFNFA